MIGGSRVSSFHWKQSSMILTDEFMFSGEKISQHGLTSRFLKLFPDIEMDEMNLLLLPPAMARKAPNLNHSIIVVHGGRYSSRSMGPNNKARSAASSVDQILGSKITTFNWQGFLDFSLSFKKGVTYYNLSTIKLILKISLWNQKPHLNQEWLQ